AIHYSTKTKHQNRPFSPKQREKDAGSRCIISMNSNITTIYDPRNAEHKKTFAFDYAYWSHIGFTSYERHYIR
uniref:Uncharacterized protein n=1 Tax=Erpetoichthys calabaricus TaxID=27687 RepID=A0A8C4SEX6_ERPCA